MTETNNAPKLGGYDYEFTSDVPEDFECPVCHLPMKDPVQIVQCGHRFCSICMESLFRLPSPFCPADRHPLSRDEIFQDTACGRKILDLIVKCPSNGCPWRGELRDVELDVHIRDECPKTEVHCEYKYLGCEAVFLRPTAKSHSESQVEGHLKLAVRSLEATKHQVQELVSHLNCQAQKMERLMTNDEEKSQQMERLKAEVAEKSKQVEQLIARDDKNTKQIEQLVTRDKENCKEMERLMEKVYEQSQQIERLRMTARKCAPFVWKISSFQAVLDRANRGFHPQNILLSEKFYLTENGYKSQIKLVLFHKERFLSLYIRIVPGKFDSLLPWPFLDKVRVSMEDQNPCKEKRENLFHVLEFAKRKERVTKPVKDDRFDCGFNIAHEVLRTRSYITNDTICITVSKEN
ncbi:TNF receptor-associated factor 6-like [Stylophora pistillata]|uniref:TNF receptor-associated factor 6-like n=1 Tax=Stylophora pistillata TaxID=50429 RepID=UPI000C03FF2D|nr:TNF receptor-associated factor 6-like [Stylophora pistillata]